MNIWKKKCKKPEEIEKNEKTNTNEKETKDLKSSSSKLHSNHTSTPTLKKKNEKNDKEIDTNYKNTYEKIVASITYDQSDKTRNNFKKLFFDSLCQKDLIQKDQTSLNDDNLHNIKDIAICIEECKHS